MKNGTITPYLLSAWLAARSLARGLPPPVADCDGYRVDTNSDTEIQRWVFPAITRNLMELAQQIAQPRYFIKVCDTTDHLRAALPIHWQIHPLSYFMVKTGNADKCNCPEEYTVHVNQTAGVTHVRVHYEDGELASSGFAAETDHAFVYDRIETAEKHRRKGLGSVIMTTLQEYKKCTTTPELLVATEAGRALYTTLGWEVLSPYATGSIPFQNQGVE